MRGFIITVAIGMLVIVAISAGFHYFEKTLIQGQTGVEGQYATAVTSGNSDLTTP